MDKIIDKLSAHLGAIIVVVCIAACICTYLIFEGIIYIVREWRRR